ncbi:MAG: FixG Ig-like domain-containing protein, partial [Arcobacteraceae bacterium]
GKLGKPSLVQWSSTNETFNATPTKIVRKTTILYTGILVIVLALLFLMGGEKEHMLLNINKTTQLYKISEDNKVSNNFLFLFQNTDSKDHTYALEIVDNPDIEIDRFEPFKLGAKHLSKKVVILSTKKVLVNDNTKDTPIPVTIKAYAVDDPTRVVVFRKAVFVFPRADKLVK